MYFIFIIKSYTKYNKSENNKITCWKNEKLKTVHHPRNTANSPGMNHYIHSISSLSYKERLQHLNYLS